MTVSVVGPITASILAVVSKIVGFDGLGRWPVDWQGLYSISEDLFINLGEALQIILKDEFDRVKSHPLVIASTASLVGALFVTTSQISSIERGWTIKTSNVVPTNGRGDVKAKTSEKISNLGISSATRVILQMEDGLVDRILVQFQLMSKGFSSRAPRSMQPSKSLALQKIAYFTLCNALSIVPFIVHLFITFNW